MFVDSCFRICTGPKLTDGMAHNSYLNNGKLPAATNCEVPYASGLCILYAKHTRENLEEFDFERIINLGDPKTSLKPFQQLRKN